jgi:Tfp pilus assembly protein PilO
MRFRGIYLWFAIPVLLAVGWILVYYIPMTSRIKSKERELSALKEEYQNIDRGIYEITKNKDRMDTLRASLREIYTEIPTTEGLPDFMKEMTTNSKRFGVVITGFNSNFSSMSLLSTSPVANLAFEISIKGRFKEIGRFLDDMESRMAYRRIKKASITYDDKEYPILTCKLLVELKTLKKGFRHESE